MSTPVFEKYTGMTLSVRSALSTSDNILYLNSIDGSVTPGTQLQIFKETGKTNNAEWFTAYYLLSEGGIDWHLLICAKSGGCITWVSTGDTGFVTTTPFNPADPTKQLWGIRVETDNKTRAFLAKADQANQAVLDVRKSVGKSGTSVIAFPDHSNKDGTNQRWLLNEITPAA